MELLGEQLEPLPQGRQAQFEYGRTGGDGGVALSVTTTTAYSYPGYYRAWLAADSRDADGTVVEWDPGAGAIAAWPDGRQAFVRPGEIDDRETLERVARNASLLGP
jgi:hypothetical protein